MWFHVPNTTPAFLADIFHENTFLGTIMCEGCQQDSLSLLPNIKGMCTLLEEENKAGIKKKSLARKVNMGKIQIWEKVSTDHTSGLSFLPLNPTRIFGKTSETYLYLYLSSMKLPPFLFLRSECGHNTAL